MNATEYINEIINTSQDETLLENVQEDSVYEAAMLLSGSFIYPLYGALWVEYYLSHITNQNCTKTDNVL